MQLLPAQPVHDAILDEQAVQLSGRVSDHSQIHTGRLVHPTVILKGKQSQEAGLSLTLTTVKTGEEREVHLRRLEDLPDLLPASTRRYNEQAFYKIPIDP